MFNRRQSQKPSDEFLKTFKATFNDLPPVTGSAAVGRTADALDIAGAVSRSLDDGQDVKDADHTPRASSDPWAAFGTADLSPSMMDAGSANFNIFAGNLPGYYTPTPGGTNTLYHPQAGDLHTPGLGVGLSTPLSLPTSEGALHAGQQVAGFHTMQPPFQQQHLQPHPFPTVHPYHMHQPPQPAFPPHEFTHQPAFDSMDGPVGDSPVDDLAIDLGLPAQHQQSPRFVYQPQGLQNSVTTAAAAATAQRADYTTPTGREKFRYFTTLSAPTAMVKHADDIPITYLNKGQTYTVNVVDTHKQPDASARYRTFVRVSFEDEQQRQKPAACWQLWKEGRGTNEAHQRGGRLQAVEYVESGQTAAAAGGGSTEDPIRPRVQLESASFDGFCVVWSPSTGRSGAASECPIQVRFNFLSTDFSHSKGVKGIPVRLCAKTELLDEQPTALGANVWGPEVCHCKVKLFRDHGAERKLSNDVAHVRKMIEKVNAQIAQLEQGVTSSGKRKRSASMAKAGAGAGVEGRPLKVPKHRRTWSLSSVTSGNGRSAEEDHLHVRLNNLQEMFTSQREMSVLNLKGDEEDDPDLHPVKIPGGLSIPVRADSGETTGWDTAQATGPQSSQVSPSPSSQELNVDNRDSTARQQQPTPVDGSSCVNPSEWRNLPQTATADLQKSSSLSLSSSSSSSSTIDATSQFPANLPDNHLTRVQSDSGGGAVLDALGVDKFYQPPASRSIKPVACLYAQLRVPGRASSTKPSLHRAIYLTQRTLRDFLTSLATKAEIEPTQVMRVVRVLPSGVQILFDDDCVRELPEGQDMVAEFHERHDDELEGNEEDGADETATSNALPCDGDVGTAEDKSPARYELRLKY